jgi:hypothetical protein
MSYFASVAGFQLVSGSLVVPLIGVWTADLQLAGEETVSGQVSVVIGNLTLVGAVFRSDAYGGQTHVRLVGGAGGWRTSITPQGYGNTAGVMLSQILGDAAAACGEKVNVAEDASIGNAWVRVNFDSSVAGDILWQLLHLGAIPAWYVDPTGITQIAAWPTVQVTTPFTVTGQKADKGVCTIATEDYVSWMPGCTFANPLLATTFTSAGVHYEWTPDGKFRFEVLTSSAAGEDRTLGPIQQVIQKELAPTRFFGRYRYIVSSPSTTTIDGSPMDTTLGLPDLQNVPLASDSISVYTPPNGSEAHIEFLDGSPAFPRCVWTAGNSNSIAVANGTNPDAKLGDTVQSVISGSSLVLVGTTLALAGVTLGACTVTATGIIFLQGNQPISGTITTGSAGLKVPN